MYSTITAAPHLVAGEARVRHHSEASLRSAGETAGTEAGLRTLLPAGPYNPRNSMKKTTQPFGMAAVVRVTGDARAPPGGRKGARASPGATGRARHARDCRHLITPPAYMCLRACRTGGIGPY